jgi:hypothetical protein
MRVAARSADQRHQVCGTAENGLGQSDLGPVHFQGTLPVSQGLPYGKGLMVGQLT